MNTFKLKIMSPDGIFYDGDAYQLSLRAVDGEVAVFADHIPYLTAVGLGECRVYTESGAEPKRAACCGGMLTFMDNEALLAPTTFEWAENINVERAKAAKEKALARLAGEEQVSDAKRSLAKLKLQRAEVRLKVAGEMK